MVKHVTSFNELPKKFTAIRLGVSHVSYRKIKKMRRVPRNRQSKIIIIL